MKFPYRSGRASLFMAAPAEPRAASGAPPTIARINTLPSGLLEMLFRYLRPHPLLAIVSVVCCRWRSAALRTVADLTLTPSKLADPRAHGLLASLSGLQRVHFWAPTSAKMTEPVVLPASVTSLLLQCKRATSLQCLVLPPVVRALELGSACALPLLPPPVWHTLERLCLNFASVERHDTATIIALQNAHLPSLRSLQLHEGWAGELLPLLRHHDAQLTDLVLSGTTGLGLVNTKGGNFDDLHLTRLHTLRLDGGPIALSRITPELVTTLLSRAPNLQALTLIVSRNILKVPPALLTALVVLKVPVIGPREAAVLDALPRLRCITTSVDAYADCSAITLSRLTLIQLHNPQYAMMWPLLTAAKSASNLSLLYENVEGDAWGAIFATNGAFPQAQCLLPLRRLHFLFKGLVLPFDALAALLRAWHTIAPLLDSISIRIKKTTQGGDIGALREVLCGLVRSGLAVALEGFPADRVTGMCKNSWGTFAIR